VDVDVDVRFTCQGGALTLTTESLDVDVEFGWYLQWLVDLMEAMDTMPDLSGMQFTTSVGVPVCPAITVDADGDVVFSLPPPTPLPPTAPAPPPLTIRTR
jgi:hypothetical protein